MSYSLRPAALALADFVLRRARLALALRRFLALLAVATATTMSGSSSPVAAILLASITGSAFGSLSGFGFPHRLA